MVNWWNMVFSLLKRVCLGKLPVCVSKVECVCVCKHVPLWECLLLHHMHHQCSYTYSIYRLLDRWSQHRCCQQRPETSGPDCCYKPSKYLETCTVKLWSEVNTCLCWHRRTLNRCVVQHIAATNSRDKLHCLLKVSSLSSVAQQVKRWEKRIWYEI